MQAADVTVQRLRSGIGLRTCLRRGGDRTVVLVHGWKQSHRLFDRTVAALGSEMTVLAYDQRGMGESDKPAGPYDFATMAQDLLDLLEEFDLRNCLVVGWSMGCTTVLEAADRDASRIARVMLMNGPLRLTRTEGFPFALTEPELAGYVEGLADAWPLGEEAFYRHSVLAENAGLAPLLWNVGMQTPLDIALALVRSQGLIDHRDAVRRIDRPILAAYSRRDPYWPLELAEWIAQEAKDGSMHVFEHSAHCPPLEEPDAFNDVIRRFHD